MKAAKDVTTKYGRHDQEDQQNLCSYIVPKCQNIWHCCFSYLPLLLSHCLLENEKMHQYEAGKQAYFPPDVGEILSSKALVCHSALGKRYMRYANI